MIENKLNIVRAKITNQIIDCPFALKPVMNQLLKGKGKNIRARLILETASGFGELNEDVLDFAAAIEILHLATLIHDDVIDNAVFRRGIETISYKFGKKIAVVAGDYLLAKCFKQLLKTNNDDIGEIVDAIMYICQGEALQNQHNRDLDISFSEYYKIIAGKTAAMFALATYGPGTILKVSGDCKARLFKTGYNIGMTFQMIDDCLDYEGVTSNIKKAVLKDLSEGVITYPLIYSFQKDPSLKKKCKKNLKQQDIDFIAKSVIELGGVDACKNQAAIFSERAKKNALRAFEQNQKNASGVINLINALTGRIG